MISPAAKHRASIASRQPTKNRQTAPQAAEFDRSPSVQRQDAAYLSQFKADKSSLSTIRSLSKRAERKRVLTGQYRDWIDEAMQAEHLNAKRADMFVWLTIWHIDAGAYDQAFDMAIFALDTGIKAPDSFGRTLPEIIAEQIADGLNRMGEQALYCDDLEALASVLNEYDLIDPIQAKLCKVRGLALKDSDPEQARMLLEQALQFNPRAGTKKSLKALATIKHEPVLVSAEPEQRTLPMETFTLSGREAARRLGVTAPTVLKWARAQPDKLPHIVIPTGNRNLYRFNSEHIEAFKNKHLVKAS